MKSRSDFSWVVKCVGSAAGVKGVLEAQDELGIIQENTQRATRGVKAFGIYLKTNVWGGDVHYSLLNLKLNFEGGD